MIWIIKYINGTHPSWFKKLKPSLKSCKYCIYCKKLLLNFKKFNLLCYYQNVHGLRTDLNELKYNVPLFNVKFFCVN